ncbi:MAG TPA: peptidase S10, partial [Granulicella sp.]
MKFRDIRLSATVLLAVLSVASVAGAQDARPHRAEQGADAKPAADADANTLPIPPETTSVTKHDWSAGSRTVHYSATAGNL